MINELVQNLIAINNTTEGQELSFADALSIVEIYDKMPEPNNLIDEAEEMAAYDIDDLEKSVIKLKEESERFLNVCLPKLNDVDFKDIAQSYSRTYYNWFQEAEKELTPYWKAYCQLNNQLDYLELDSSEYMETEKHCEEANKNSVPVFRFRADFLEAVIIRYHDIAIAILTDIKRIREGGS